MDYFYFENVSHFSMEAFDAYFEILMNSNEDFFLKFGPMVIFRKGNAETQMILLN